MAGSITCGTALPEDRPFLLNLWGRVFGDAPATAAPCLDRFAGVGNVLVARQGAVPIAMLLLVPCHIGGTQGVYLYALATEPAQRGAGVMSALMAHSEALAAGRGAAFAALIPATRALYPYYQKRGYTNCLRLRHVRVPLPPLARAGTDTAGRSALLEALTGAQLAQWREQWLLPGSCGSAAAPAIQFNAARTALCAEDLAEAGAVLAVHPRKTAYAVALRRKNEVLVAELAGRGDDAALSLLHALVAHWGLPSPKTRVTLPLFSPLFVGKGVARPVALLKALAPDFAFDTQTYLRFAMDEAFVFGIPQN